MPTAETVEVLDEDPRNIIDFNEIEQVEEEFAENTQVQEENVAREIFTIISEVGYLKITFIFLRYK